MVTTLLLVCRSTQLTECVVERLARGHIKPMLGQDLSQVVEVRMVVCVMLCSTHVWCGRR